jgi:tellurite resistance protein TerC
VTGALGAPLWMWIAFGSVVLVSLALDLVAHRGAHGASRTSAIRWSVGWILAALLFSGFIALELGWHPAEDFLSAYLMEKSLSIDNLFVFMVIFDRLRIPQTEHHRVLFWGILGALVARAVFIASGSALLSRWHDVVYLLGAFLIYTAYKTLRAEPGCGGDRLVGVMQRSSRLTHKLDGHRFITVENGKRVGTPLLVALLAIEASDVLFAVDSVPAVFAISEDPFIVYSSNVFAILGLRALYLLLAGLLRDLHYLRFGLAGILAFAGAKMLLSGYVHVPPAVSLLLILTILAAAILASIRRRSDGMRDAVTPP